MKRIPFYLIFLLAACNEPEIPQVKKETFSGRYTKRALYQTEVPLHWQRIEPEGDLRDTKIPIVSYQIEDALLTLHTFPYSSFEMRIPPEAQVERWKRQFNNAGEVTQVAHGGFGGFRHEIEGEMIGYAMQLSPVLFKAILDQDIRADYTIKCVGPQITLEKYRDEIDDFATNFEWIVPIAYDEISR